VDGLEEPLGVEPQPLAPVERDVPRPELACDGHRFSAVAGVEEPVDDLVPGQQVRSPRELRQVGSEALVGDAPADQDHRDGGEPSAGPLQDDLART